MPMHTTLAIFGVASPLGEGLATCLAAGPYRLLLWDADGARTQRLVEALQRATPTADVEALGCARTASWEADALILALPACGHAELARQIVPFVTQKLVLPFADPVHPQCVGRAVERQVVETLQRLLPHSKVRPFPAYAASLLAAPALSASLCQLLHRTLQAATLG